MEPKISIIVPCYNILNWTTGEKYLYKAINSLKRQSFGFDNLEVILVDDGSIDGTSSLIKKISEEENNIYSIILKENVGQGMARYYGVKKAKSKYIMFLDADDEFTSDACAKLYDIIERKDADMVSSNYITNLNGVNYEGFEYDLEYKEFKPTSLKSFQKQNASYARIFKRELIENIKNEASHHFEDVYLNYKAFQMSEKVIYLNDFYSYIHNVNYDSLTLNPSVEEIKNSFNHYSIVIDIIENPDDTLMVIQDLFATGVQAILSYNFSYNENKEIFKYFEKIKNETMEKYSVNNDILDTTIPAKFINFFIRHNHISLLSLLIRPIQLVLSSKTIYKFLFIHVKKHKPYTGKI